MEYKSRRQTFLWCLEILWIFWSSLFIQQYAEDFIVSHNLWHLWRFKKLRITSAYAMLVCCIPFSLFLLIYFQEKTTSQARVVTTDFWTHTAWKNMLGYLFLTEYVVSHLKWWHDTNTNQQKKAHSSLCYPLRIHYCGDLGHVLTGQALSLN